MSGQQISDPLANVAARYAVAITPAMEALIDPGDPADPIALQFRPDARELDVSPDESVDPIGDEPHTPVKGVVHRYADRCLLKLVHVCPVYCRFCFRREMVGPAADGMLSGTELDEALAYIAAHADIWEVIFTGGDPFMLSGRRLREIAARVAAIDHVKIMRWHTRVSSRGPIARDARGGRGATRRRRDDVRRAAHQPPARADYRRESRDRAHRRCRCADAFADRAAEWRQRRCRDPRAR